MRDSDPSSVLSCTISDLPSDRTECTVLPPARYRPFLNPSDRLRHPHRRQYQRPRSNHDRTRSGSDRDRNSIGIMPNHGCGAFCIAIAIEPNSNRDLIEIWPSTNDVNRARVLKHEGVLERTRVLGHGEQLRNRAASNDESSMKWTTDLRHAECVYIYIYTWCATRARRTVIENAQCSLSRAFSLDIVDGGQISIVIRSDYDRNSTRFLTQWPQRWQSKLRQISATIRCESDGSPIESVQILGKSCLNFGQNPTWFRSQSQLQFRPQSRWWFQLESNRGSIERTTMTTSTNLKVWL